MNAGDFGIGTGVGPLLRLPFRLTLDTSRFGDALPAGVVGPILLIFIPLGILAIWKSVEARILGLVAAVYFLLWAESFQYARYYLAILPIIAIVAMAGVTTAAQTRVARLVQWPALLVMLLFQVTVLPLRYWNIPERFPVDYVLGRERREEFLERSLDGYRGAALINKLSGSQDRVLGIDTEFLRFYLRPPLESMAESLLGSRMRDEVSGIPPGPDLARTLQEMKLSYLITSRTALVDPLPFYPYAAKGFLKDYASLIYADEFVAVYRFNGPETRQPLRMP
jgi:hypothetical protein